MRVSCCRGTGTVSRDVPEAGPPAGGDERLGLGRRGRRRPKLKTAAVDSDAPVGGYAGVAGGGEDVAGAFGRGRGRGGQ